MTFAMLDDKRDEFKTTRAIFADTRDELKKTCTLLGDELKKT